ncbi:MAG: hypothetical protein IJG58_07155 [Oscillospiraceae bacterium]|nr:hypothetical protein [Oscillospiraceae bacterium]
MVDEHGEDGDGFQLISVHGSGSSRVRMKVLYHGSTHFRKSGGIKARAAHFVLVLPWFAWYGILYAQKMPDGSFDPGV